MSPQGSKENVFKNICEYPIPTYVEWKLAVEKSLKGAPFSRLLTRTYEEIVLQPMYQQRDIENLAFIKTLPGEFPFVRGTEDVAGEKSWLVAQEMNHPLPETLNQWLKNDLQKGVNAIHLVLHEDVKLGTNTSSNRQIGTTILNLEDVETIFKDIDVTTYPFMMQCGTNVAIIGLIAAYFQKNNIPFTKLRGCIGTDPLTMLLQEGTLSSGMDCYLNQMAEVIKWKTVNDVPLKTIFIDGDLYHNSGASGSQELSFMLATGVYYIRELQKRGCTIDQIASSICFSMSIGSNIFMELAKIRSARMLWSNIVEAFGGELESQKLFIHASTSKWTKTVYDPYVNMLRGTVEAFAAALGGVDSLHVSPFDEPFTLPNDFSRRIARNIQFIIQEEANITKTWDPAGGSWYVEHLTDEIANKSWELFQHIEEVGGMFKAIQEGIPQKLIEDVSTKKKEDIEKRKLIFVGATMYPNSSETFKEIDNKALIAAIEQRIKTQKQQAKDISISINIENMMSDMIKASETGASVEEIMHTIGSGNSVSVTKLITYRATEAFELLRQVNDQRKLADKPFHVFLTTIGTLAQHKQRSDFITSFFETGGFNVMRNTGFETSEEAISATVHTEAKIAVICGKNESYSDHALQIVKEVKSSRPDMKIYLAGKQETEFEKQLLDAGLNGFIHIGTNCYQLLKELQSEKEDLVNETS